MPISLPRLEFRATLTFLHCSAAWGTAVVRSLGKEPDVLGPNDSSLCEVRVDPRALDVAESAMVSFSDWSQCDWGHDNKTIEVIRILQTRHTWSAFVVGRDEWVGVGCEKVHVFFLDISILISAPDQLPPDMTCLLHVCTLCFVTSGLYLWAWDLGLRSSLNTSQQEVGSTRSQDAVSELISSLRCCSSPCLILTGWLIPQFPQIVNYKGGDKALFHARCPVVLMPELVLERERI